MAKSSYQATGHLKPREVIPESQVRAICNASSEGRGYRQIVSTLRALAPYNVTNGEIQRFGGIARSRGCGTNNYRMALTQEAVDSMVAKVRGLSKEACPVKPTRRVIRALLEQKAQQAAQRRRDQRVRKR